MNQWGANCKAYAIRAWTTRLSNKLIQINDLVELERGGKRVEAADVVGNTSVCRPRVT